MKLDMPLTHALVVLATAIASLVSNSQAAAQGTHEWNDPAGGVWGTFIDWTPIGVPSSLDTARFNLNADYTVSFIQDRQVQLLQVLDGDVTLEGSGIAPGDRTLTVEDALINPNAEVVITPGSSGKNLTLNTTDDMVVRGTLQVSSGARLINAGAVVDSLGQGNLIIRGISSGGQISSWTATSLDVGSIDSGLVRIEGGGFSQINGPVILGDQSGSDGEVMVTGQTSGGIRSDFRSTGTITVGNAGNGHLKVVDGAFSATSGAILGEQAGGRGTATIESNTPGDPAFWIAGNLTVRRGDVVVNSGGTMRTFGATVGTHANSSVTVSGAGSGGTDGLWEAQGVTTISSLADATLDIEQGGLVNAQDINVGADAGGVGRVNVSSPSPAQASQLLQTGDLYLGGNEFGPGGEGHLTLSTNSFARIDGTTTIYQNSRVVMGPGSTLIAPTIVNDNGGSFDFLSGTLHTTSYTGHLTHQGGTLAPYRSSSPTGEGAGDMVIAGNYIQQAGATLAIDIIDGSGCGLGYDHLEVTGNATLGGMLALSLAEGFTPDPLSTFNILAADSLGGQFANALPGERLDTIDGRGSFVVNYGNTSPFNADSVILSDFAVNGLLPGDYNGDEFVSQADLDLILLNWGDSVLPAGFNPSAIPGGGPFDGLISQNELDGVLLNWGNQLEASTVAAVAVPEPGSMSLTILVVSALCVGRRVKRIEFRRGRGGGNSSAGD